MSLLLDTGLLIPETPTITYMRSLVNTDLGANAILRQLTAAGIGMNRKLGLAAIRTLRGKQITRPYVKSVNLNSQIDFSRLQTSSYEISTLYRYDVVYTGVNMDTGEEVHSYHTILSDNKYTKQQAVILAESELVSKSDKYRIQWVDGQTENIFLQSDEMRYA